MIQELLNQDMNTPKFFKLESTISDRNLIFIVEVGFQVVSKFKRGRSKIGLSSYIQVSAPGPRNISVFAAMNKYGMVYHKIHKASINGEDFKQYITGLSAVCYSKQIENPIFILDNARIHHYNRLNEMIRNLNLIFFFLPPYSPFLNPIEDIFAKWKNAVIRSESQNQAKLVEIID